MNSERRNEAKQVLQRLRESLADISLKNRFLNFSPDQSLEINQPDLDTIFKYLISQKAIPIRRTQERQSNKSEKSISGDIFTPQVSRNVMEVTKPEQQLEGSLRKLHNLYQSHLEEVGCNALFLSIGMFQWSKQGKSEKTNLAPLLLVPVGLERQVIETNTLSSHSETDQTRRLTFSLSYAEESICENSTLLQLLRRPEYNLHLPRFLIDTHSKPSEYLQEVEEWLKKAPSNLVAGWKIHSTVTLMILPTSSQAMNRDLDPSAWPGEGLLENQNVLSLLVGDDNIRKEELPFEDVDRFHRQFDKMPTILEADGSQTRALIRVVRGSNLVIEGPPGTGKSQTIANMIALALHQGNTVLFVAEKLEALKVVRARLEEVGLGNFCLELHSKKSIPKEVIAQIRRRLNVELSVQNNLEYKINKIKDGIIQCVDVLNAHCRLMATTIPELNMTISQLIGKLESTRQRLQRESSGKIGYQSSLPVFIQGKKPSLEELEEVRRRLKHLGKHIDENIHLSCLAWKGFEPLDLADDDLGYIKNALWKAKEHVERWEGAVAMLPQVACLDLISRPVVHYKELAGILEAVRPPKKIISIAAIALSRGSFSVNDYKEFIKKMRVLRECKENNACKLAANREISDEFLENAELFFKNLIAEGWGKITLIALKQQQSNTITMLSVLENMRLYLEKLNLSIHSIESANTISHYDLDSLIEKVGLFNLGQMEQSVDTMWALAIKLQTRLPEFSRFIKELNLYLEEPHSIIQTKSSYLIAADKINNLLQLGCSGHSLAQLKQLHQQLIQANVMIKEIYNEFDFSLCLNESINFELLQQLSIFFDKLGYVSREEIDLLSPTYFEADTIKFFEEALIRNNMLNDVYKRLKNCFKMDSLPPLTALTDIHKRLSKELEKDGKIASIGRWLHNVFTGEWSGLQEEIANFISGPMNIDKNFLNDLTALKEFLKEEREFLANARYIEKLGPSFAGRNTVWGSLKNIVELTSQLSTALPVLKNNQLVVELTRSLKSNMFVRQIGEKINSALELLQNIFSQIPKVTCFQTPLLTLSSTFCSLENELAEIFEYLPYNEHYWNVPCEILSAKIAETNEILENFQQSSNHIINPKCQQAIESLYNFQTIFSNRHVFNGVVHTVRGILDFMAMIPNLLVLDPENLCNTLTLEQIEQKIYNWVTHIMAFCEAVKALNFEDDMMIGEIAKELKEIGVVLKYLQRNKQTIRFQDLLKTLENVDKIPRRQLLLTEIKDSLVFIDQCINKFNSISSVILNEIELASTITEAINTMLSWIKKADILDDHSRILFFDTQATIQSCLEQISTTKLYRKYMVEIDNQAHLNSFLDEHYKGLWQTDLEAIEKTVQWADHVITAPLLGGNVIPWMIGEGAEIRYSALLSGLEKMKIHSDAWVEALSHFEDIGKVDPNSKISFRNQSRNLASIKEDLSRALADVKSLPRWMEYQQCLGRINETGCGDLVKYAIEQNLQGEAPVLLAEAAFYQQWMKEIANRETTCRLFNRIEYEGVREEFASLDRGLPCLSRQLVLIQTSNRGKYAPKGNNKGLVAEFSEMGLLQHEITKDKRYQPVRDIIERAGNSLRSLMPCWLMSPQSVAQFIAPSAENFDLLIIDEASQIRPEEALGSIA